MIKYKAGYKYQITEDRTFQTPVFPTHNIIAPFISLSDSGLLKVFAGYAWDGASGPTFDTKNSMTPSLVHDCFCQLIREDKLPSSERKPADKHFRIMCRERGMSAIRAWIWYQGVRFGAKYNEQKPKPILEAP